MGEVTEDIQDVSELMYLNGKGSGRVAEDIKY
jgi:hypothetical protein